MTFQLFKTRRGQWRWRLRARNGKLVACSGEAYRRRADCMAAIDLVRATDYATQVEDVTR